MLFIDAYGAVSFCPTLTHRENSEFLAGNVNEDSLKNIWERSTVFKKLQGMQCNRVDDCNVRDLCKGGCRSRAYLATGDPCAPDRAMCLFYGIEQKA